MSFGLLLITRHRIGAELLETETRMIGRYPFAALAIEVLEQDDSHLLRDRVPRSAERLDQGGGVLVQR